MKLRLAAAAKSDLDEIWLRLAVEASEAAADRIADSLAEALWRLQAFPDSGSPRENVGPGVRILTSGVYVAYHVVTVDEVVVTRIVHGSQDARRLTGLLPTP